MSLLSKEKQTVSGMHDKIQTFDGTPDVKAAAGGADGTGSAPSVSAFKTICESSSQVFHGLDARMSF